MQRAVTSGVATVRTGEWGGRLREILSALAGVALPHRRGSARVAELTRENERLREELRQLRGLVEHAGRLSALGTLAAGIAHEIRNPLVAVRTFFQLAPQRWHDEEFATDFRIVTEKEVLRISDLVMELLSIAKPPVRSREDVDVSELIARTVLLLAPQARRHQVRLEQAGSERSPLVTAAADQLKQVVLNIVLNAIEATPPGGTVTVGASGILGPSGRICRIEVRDTGAGIPVDLHDGIFEPFFTTKPGGTGLGLSIARRIVAEHGGIISVLSSSNGNGTRFHVDLPCVADVR